MERENKVLERERNVQKSEEELLIRERATTKEYKALVAKLKLAHEEKLRKEIENVVQQNSEEIRASNRECKRLQSSLKDVMASNRILRDMNKSLNNELAEKQEKLDHLSAQVKLFKEKSERMKTIKIEEEKEKNDLISVFKMQLLAQKVASTSIGTQTLEENDENDNDMLLMMNSLLSLYLKYPNAESKCEKTISSSFHLFQKHCILDRVPQNSLELETISLFLQYLNTNMHKFSTSDKFQISRMLYEQLPRVHLLGNSLDSMIIYVLHHMIPIASILQTNIIEILLKRLLEYCTKLDRAKGLVLKFGLHHLLNLLIRFHNSETIGVLSSSLILSVTSQG